MDELEKLKAENAKLKQEIRFYMVEIDLSFSTICFETEIHTEIRNFQRSQNEFLEMHIHKWNNIMDNIK